LAGTCLRWAGRCNDVLTDLQCVSGRSKHDLSGFSTDYRAATCYASLDGPNRSCCVQDGRESRVSSCLAVATHVTEQQRTGYSVRRYGSGWHGPCRMTPARSGNWRSSSRFCKKLAPKDCRSSGKAQPAFRIHPDTQWPPTTTRRGREPPRDATLPTKRLPAPPSPSASRHRETSCIPSSVCAFSMARLVCHVTDACVQLLHPASMCPPLPSSPL
jgi:hypothetical protein